MRRSHVKLKLLVLAMLALLVSPASAATFFTAKTTTGASSAVDSGNAKSIRVHVFRSDAAAASTAVVTIQQSLDGTNWYTVATISNPTGMNATTGDGGEVWSVPSIFNTRAYVVSRSAGSLTATIEVQR